MSSMNSKWLTVSGTCDLRPRAALNAALSRKKRYDILFLRPF